MNAAEARRIAEQTSNAILVNDILNTTYDAIAFQASKRNYGLAHTFRSDKGFTFTKFDVEQAIAQLRADGYKVEECGNYNTSDGVYVSSYVQISW